MCNVAPLSYGPTHRFCAVRTRYWYFEQQHLNNSSSQQKHNIPLLVLRSTVFWVWTIVNTLLLTIPVLVSSLFSFNFALYVSKIWLRLNLFGLRHICGVTWKVDGVENIPSHACIVLSKHQSTWETYFLPTMFPRSVYVAKRSLVLIPLFGWCIAALKFILIDRKSGASAINQMVDQSKQRLDENISVIIFPEGTRVPLGAEPNYRIGGAIVAEKIKADIIPVALNAGEFWPRMGYIKWPGQITVSFGPAIKPENKTAPELMDETQTWIENRMKEISVTDRFPY